MMSSFLRDNRRQIATEADAARAVANRAQAYRPSASVLRDIGRDGQGPRRHQSYEHISASDSDAPSDQGDRDSAPHGGIPESSRLLCEPSQGSDRKKGNCDNAAKPVKRNSKHDENSRTVLKCAAALCRDERMKKGEHWA